MHLPLLLVVGALALTLAAAPSAEDGRYHHARYHAEGGTPAIARSPVTLEELELLKKTVLLTEDDVRLLRRSRAVLEPQVDEILDTWYGFVGANPHLLASFSNAEGEPDARYLARVRARFGQWILDTADARFDQEWLDYQHEVGLRHHRTRKNATDGADASDQVAFRYLVALHSPITITLEPFLAAGDASPEEVRAMHAAWSKAVLLQVILWSRPYVRDGDF